MNNKQKGFTIIELVVVILLLGILTATALPRFMDVTDQAHGAVVTGVMTGLNTSSALAHASWVARGEPTSLPDYASMKANSNGFVIGASTVTVKLNTDCTTIFTTLLQAGGQPTIAAATGTGAAAAADVSVATTDFVGKVSAGTCQYIYTGQFESAAAGDVPVLVYTASTGVVSEGTDL